MAFENYQGIKFENGTSTKVTDALTVEEALEISINGNPFTVTMRTPGDDLELIRGLLYSEDVYTQIDTPYNIVVLKKNTHGVITKVDLKLDEQYLCKELINSRTFLSSSSCGICGKTELQDVKGFLKNNQSINPTRIFKMFEIMNSKQNTFRHSGGSHAATSFNKNGDLLSSKEDIGRHNAVDKVIGEMIEKKTLKSAFCMTVSGRISYEIIIKCFRAKIPILAAISAPSTLSVDYAKELGITILGFSRKNKTTCYANPQRIQKTKTINIARVAS